MRETRKVLLGATKDMSLIFAEVGYHTNSNSVKEFTASFSQVTPTEVDDDYLKERVTSLLDCLDKGDLYGMCSNYDCTPDQLPEVYFDQIVRFGGGVEEILDISLYPESYTVQGAHDDIYFESVGAGQGDYFAELIPINKEFSDWLQAKWYRFHLKEVSDEWVEVLKHMLDDYESLLTTLNGEEGWIQNWLETKWYPTQGGSNE